MDPRTPPQIEMTPDGRFRMPERPALSVRIQRTALIVALLAGVLATALLALWFALVLIPVAAGAADRCGRADGGQRSLSRTFIARRACATRQTRCSR
jgi:hypothetical protein